MPVLVIGVCGHCISSFLSCFCCCFSPCLLFKMLPDLLQLSNCSEIFNELNDSARTVLRLLVIFMSMMVTLN